MKIVKWIISIFLSIVLCGLIILIITVVIPTHNSVSVISDTLGNKTGKWVGTAIGTYEGVTEEALNGWEDGKMAGLSADDTQVEIVNSEINLGKGRIQVLEAKITINNDVNISNDYAALYEKKGYIIFTVDLNETVYEYSNNTLIVKIPAPKAEVTIDDSQQCVMIAEYESFSLIDRGEAGFEAAINSRAEIIEKTVEELDNYSVLYAQARASAIEQIEALAIAASHGTVVEVKIIGE